MRIVFFGSDPWFSPPVLEALLSAGFEMPVVVTKGKMRNEFDKLIELNKLETRLVEGKMDENISRERLRAELDGIATGRTGRYIPRNDEPSLIINHQPSAIVLASFGPPFLSDELLNWPKYGCLNVHASLLPRWRGASPVFGAIANGDKETGVSIMRMTEEIDLGPILGQKRIVIRPGLATQGQAFTDYDTRESLTRRLGILGGKLIVKTLENIENGQINEVKQPSKSPTFYTHRLTKDLGRIDWKKSPVETERFIRAVTPWPGAFTSAKFLPDFAWTKSRRAGKVQSSKWQTIPELKILKAHLEASITNAHRPNQQPITNNQQLIPDLVQLPGKNPISWKAFLAGHPGAELE